MWCPNGYVTFLEIQAVVRGVVKAARHEQVISRWGSDSLKIAEEEKWVLRECMNEFFQTCPSLSVFSPSAVVLRCDERIVSTRRIPSIGWQYSFIDQSTGTISEVQFDKCFSEASPNLEEFRKRLDELDEIHSMHHERFTNEAGVDAAGEYSLYDWYCDLSKIEDDVSNWKIFKQFDGWAVGCLESDLARTPTEYLSLDFWSEVPVEERQEIDLKSQIIQLFDDGQIRSKPNTKQQYFGGESREAFRAAWSEAAKERPELSKRGPKSRM